MNNDEMKRKIVDIIGDVYLVNAPIKDVFKPIFVERIADSLILAGIGDVKEAERKLFVFKNELAEMIQCFTRMETLYKIKSEEVKIKEHRAEVAERALDLCETAYILALNGREHEGISQQAIVSDLGVHGFFMEQAEKELSGERKDD